MDTSFIYINGKKVGSGGPVLIVGEVAQAHDGSLGMAHAMIDAIAREGADAVKFQTHIARAESSPREPFRVKFSLQDETRFDYWKRMEFSEDQWAGLAQHARERGLIFLSSPFSEEAVDLLIRLSVPAWKIASGEVTNPLILDQIARTGLPVLLSTGMSTIAEIDQVVANIRKRDLPLLILQCTSKYPSLPEDIGLNLLAYYRERYQIPVGISDHSGVIYTGLAAATLGAALVEVHVTLSRDNFGPDVPVSLTPIELNQLVTGVRFIEKALANPVDKDQIGASMESMRVMFGKSLVAKHDLTAGQVLAQADLTARKPGDGIPVSRLEEVIGKVVRRDILQDEFIDERDLSDPDGGKL